MSALRPKEMFREMVVKKDISQVCRYDDPAFKRESNGMRQGYAEFPAAHQRVYDT